MGGHLRTVTGVTLGLVGVATAVGLLVWPRLPAEMAIHFSLTGSPDNYVSRPIGVFLLPAIMLLTLALLRRAFRVDPPRDPRIAPVTTVSTIGLLAVVHIIVLAWNLGYPIPFDLVMGGILLWTAGLVGYVVIRERGSS